jgi:hypothetical protein
MNQGHRDSLIGGPRFGPMLFWFMGNSGLSRFLLWLVWDSHIRLPGNLGAWLFGFAIGRWPHRVKEEKS